MGDLEGSCAGIADEARFGGERTNEEAQAFDVFPEADYCKRPYGIVRSPPLITCQGGKRSEPESGRKAKPCGFDVDNALVVLLQVERSAEPEGCRCGQLS